MPQEYRNPDVVGDTPGIRKRLASPQAIITQFGWILEPLEIAKW
jgi:hypothetical protein